MMRNCIGYRDCIGDNDTNGKDKHAKLHLTTITNLNPTYRDRIAAISTDVFSYLKENTAWCVQMGCIALGAVSAFTVTYMQYYNNDTFSPANHENTSSPTLSGDNITFSIAHGMGAAIKYVFFPLVAVTTLRVSTTILQNSNQLNCILDFSKRFRTHKVIAGAFGVASLVHTAGQLYINPASIASQEGITGIVILGSFAVPLAGAYFLKKSGYIPNIPYQISFLHPHQLGALALTVAYATHNFDYRLLPYAAAFSGVFTLDRLFECICYNFTTIVSGVKILGDQLVEVRVATPPTFRSSLPGQYVYLSFPKEIDSCIDHDHPFTLANSFHENELRFIIAKRGRWTNQLITKIKNNAFPLGTQAKIVGPFGSPLQSLAKKNNLILVSTGSGMSPFLSILHYHAIIKAPMTLTIIHSSRNKEEFLPLMAGIKRATQSGVYIKESHFYLTNHTEEQFKRSFQYLSEYLKNSGINVVDVDGIADSHPEETASSESDEDADEIKIDIKNTTVSESQNASNNVIYSTIYAHNNRFNPLSNDIFRCADIFLMATPQDGNFMLSDTNHLYLYKVYGQLICQYANETKVLDEKEIGNVRAALDADFDIAERAPDKQPVKCKSKEMCKSILNVTSNNSYTLFPHSENENREPEDANLPQITNLQAMERYQGTFFYCGNKKLGNVLQKICRKKDDPFTKEAFSF